VQLVSFWYAATGAGGYYRSTSSDIAVGLSLLVLRKRSKLQNCPLTNLHIGSRFSTRHRNSLQITQPCQTFLLHPSIPLVRQSLSGLPARSTQRKGPR